MRIVLATETFLPHVDGIVTRLTHTVAQLQRAGDEVLIISPQRRADSPTEFAGAPILTLPSISAAPLYPDIRLAQPVLSPRVESAIARFQPDIFHVAAPAFSRFWRGDDGVAPSRAPRRLISRAICHVYGAL